MKLSKKEREELGAAIQAENEMLKRVTNVIRNASIALFVCMLFVLWGFTGMSQKFLPDINPTVRAVIAWIALAGAVVSFLFVVFGFVARHNGKKHLIGQIDKYQGKK